MSSELSLKLEDKINLAVELIKGLRLQLSEAKETNELLQKEIDSFKNHQRQWEKTLSELLRKLDSAELTRASFEASDEAPNFEKGLGLKSDLLSESEDLLAYEDEEEYEEEESLAHF